MKVLNLKGYKIVAGLLSMFLTFALIIAPIFIYAAIAGIGWNDTVPLPDWLLWFIVLGGAIGAGLVIPVHRSVICKIGGYPKESARIKW
jgi:hypothetical protein